MEVNWNTCVDMDKGLQSMLGLIFTKVEVSEGNEDMVFHAEDGRRFIFTHLQDCCESVSISDIVGDLQDLVGEPLLRAEESSNDDLGPPREYYDSYTWTFYKFATRKGYVDVRWLGESNGYYSERVDLCILT